MNYRMLTTRLGVAAALLVCGSIAVAEAPRPTLDELVQDLRGGDEIKRSLARQFIPRYGIGTMAQLIPLLKEENASISWAANKVILDIANDVSVPGREADRATVAKQLLDALAATDVQSEQFTLLRILPIVIPEGADLSAIDALLYQDHTRERARRALQESGTTEARAALRTALPKVDAIFACALMDALDKTGDAEAIPLIANKLVQGTPAEQAAAARALAPTGDPAYREPFLALARTIDINHRFAVEDATLRLADAMAVNGGAWDASMALFRTLLEQSDNPVIQGGALAGLGRRGDASVMDTILSTWASDASGLLEAPAMAAIESLNDPAVPERLMTAFPEQSPAIQERLLGIMARTQDPRYLPLFEGAESLSPALRIDALSQYHVPQSIPLLEALATTDDAGHGMKAAEAIRTMGTAFRDQGNPQGTGRAYLALYRIARDDAGRAEALEGIKAYPVAEAYDELKSALGENGLLELSPQVLTGMARVLAEAQRGEEANLLKTALLTRATDTGTVQQLIQMGPVSGSEEDFARQLGFINEWHIALPFPLKDAPTDGRPVMLDGTIDLTASFGEGDKKVAWTPTKGAGAMALVNFPLQDQVRAFAYATIHVAEGQDATLRIGSDDGVRAWVNGVQVHENITDRGTALDNDLVPVKLQGGDNTILLEIIQHGGGWNFCARLTTPEGAPLVFEQK